MMDFQYRRNRFCVSIEYSRPAQCGTGESRNAGAAGPYVLARKFRLWPVAHRSAGGPVSLDAGYAPVFLAFRISSMRSAMRFSSPRPVGR